MSTTQTLGASGATLLVLELACWLIMLLCLFNVTGKEVHGDASVGHAFTWFAAMAFAGLTWLWLGGLLLKTGTEGMLPAWAGGAAVVLFLVSGAAAAAAMFLLQEPARVWPVIVPVLIPPLLGFYVLALYQASLRPFFFAGTGGLAIWVAVLALTLAPWPALFLKLNRDRLRAGEDVKAAAAWKVQERARIRTENLAKLQAMTPDKPLMHWYELLDEDSGVRPEALEALRHVERRQADIEDMLAWGVLRAMMLVPDLDLKATSQLCEAARTFMLKHAKESRVRPKQDPREYAAGDYVEPSLAGVRWLIAHGCDCDEGVAAMQASVETFLDTPDRKAALNALAGLRRK